MMKSVIIVGILAIAAYFLLRPTTFVAKSDIFMYKSPSDVYAFMSDLKRTIEKHTSIGGKNGKCTLLRQRTRPDGVQEKLFLVEKAMPIWQDFVLPFNMEIRLTLSKPNKELLYNSSFLRGYLLKLHGRMTFEAREGRVMEGTFLTEELTVTSPWLTHIFIKKHLEESQKDTLVSLRNGLESMPVSKEKMETLSGDGKKMEKKETSSKENVRRDESKEPSDKPKQKLAETSGKQKQEAAKDAKAAKKEEQSASKDTNTRQEQQSREPKVEKKQDGNEAKTARTKDAASQTEQKDGGEKVEKDPRQAPKKGKKGESVKKEAEFGEKVGEDSKDKAKSKASEESEPPNQKDAEKPKAKVIKPMTEAPKNDTNGG